LDAGCDAVLACHPELVDDALGALPERSDSRSAERLAQLRPTPPTRLAETALTQARATLAALA
jgi:hypothetical protein